MENDPARTTADVYLFADYIRDGRIDDGLKTLDDVIKRNPSNANAIGVKAQVYQSQGRIDEAKDSYMQALKVDPNFEAAANNLAWLLAEGGTDLNTALNWAQLARKKQPENAEMADTLGWVYYKLGNYVLARDQVKFALSKQPDNASFLYHLGMIYKGNRQFAEAQGAFKKAASSKKEVKEKTLAQAALKEIANLNN